MLLFFAIGFVKLTIIFVPNLPLFIRQTCGLKQSKLAVYFFKIYNICEVNQYGKRIH